MSARTKEDANSSFTGELITGFFQGGNLPSCHREIQGSRTGARLEPVMVGKSQELPSAS
jgi:hypothetical protein